MKAVITVILLIMVLCLIKSILFPETVAPVFRGFTHEEAPWDPPVQVDSILTPEECRRVIDMSEPNFTRSELVGSVPSNVRTSETAWLSKSDPISQKIIQRVHELTGSTENECEQIQVVKYKPGTYYREHHDSCCDESRACLDFEKQGGQRNATLLVYLNDDFEEGETWFPKLDLKLRAPPGSGILFRPLGRDEAKCHPKALHAGLPIKSGTKYICNVWVRESKFM